MMGAIYKITNTRNGKCYVGSTTKPLVRKFHHLARLRAGKHHSPKLQKAFRKYGADAFTFEVIEECAAEDLISREQHLNGDEVPKTCGETCRSELRRRLLNQRRIAEPGMDSRAARKRWQLKQQKEETNG